MNQRTTWSNIAYSIVILYFFSLYAVFNHVQIPQNTWTEVVKLDTPQAVVLERGAPMPYFQRSEKIAKAVTRIYKVPASKSKLYAELIIKHSDRFGLDPHLLAGLIGTESKFKANAVSPGNAKGLTQVIAYWHPEKVRGRNLFDPDVSIEVGTRVLAQCFKTRKTRDGALACYNGATTPEARGAYIRAINSHKGRIKRAIQA